MKRIFELGKSSYRFLRRWLRISRFYAGGEKPWSRGYFEYKWRAIAKAINDPRLRQLFERGGNLPRGYGFGIDERIIELPWALAQLSEQPLSLLDAGSALNFLPLIIHSKLKNKKLTIITLAPETNNFSRQGVRYTYGDMRKLRFADQAFDAITCISTLEHVGLDNQAIYTHEQKYAENHPADYLVALKQLYRVLRPGGTLLLTVPFGQYVNIGFMQQFTPEMVDKVVSVCPWKQSVVTYYKYHSGGWDVSTREQAEGVKYFNIHTTKKIEADGAAAARAVACIKLTK